MRYPAALLLLFVSFAQAEEPWTRHVIDDSSRGADGVRLADFNGDGRPDVVTGWEEGGITRIYLQPEKESLREKWPAVTVGKTRSVEDAVAVDLDGDGRLDVVTSTEGRERTLFVHWGPATNEDLLDESKWLTQPIPDSVQKQIWMFCLPLQVDGKRGVDLVVGSKGSGAAIGWWESPENPRLLEDWKYHHWIDAGWVMSLIAQDVDRDGDEDVIVSDRRGEARGLKWLENPGRDADATARWKPHSIGALGKEVMFAAVGDLDRDGGLDLMVPTWNGSVGLFQRVRNVSPPTWKASSIPNPYGFRRGKSITVADFDLDGTQDFVMTMRCEPVTAPAVVLMRHVGRPFAGKWQHTDIGGEAGSKFDLLEPLDLDGDGDLDLITCEEVANLGVFWYENPTRP